MERAFFVGIFAAFLIGHGPCAFAQTGGRGPATQNSVNTLNVTNIRNTTDDQALPKLELGLGASGVFINDYPGSNQQHYVWLPIPYLVYRGNFLRADQNGDMRGVFLQNAEIDIDASASGSVPVNSNLDQAREGMPNLDWMGEVGPRLLVHIYRSSKYSLEASVPVRWVFSTDLTRIDDRGFDFNPEIYLRRRAWFDPHGTVLAYYGALWGTSQLTRYFYEVSPQYATADRPVYSAVPGYMYDYVGFEYHHTSSPTSPLIMFVGVSESFLAGAANRLSPLMLSIENQEVIAGFIYDFYRSKEKAPPNQEFE